MRNVPLRRRLRTVLKASRPRRIRCLVEVLEDRLAPATFNVNSLADILTAPPSGIVTLRSAIQAANSTHRAPIRSILTIPGTYAITRLGTSQESDNGAGEFAITGTSNLTIVNTSGGLATIDGGGLNRVFDINPAAATTPFTVTFNGVTITGGNAAPLDAADGSGGGVRVQGAASVVLNNVLRSPETTRPPTAAASPFEGSTTSAR